MLNYVLLKMAIMDFQTTPKQTNKQKQTKKTHIFCTLQKTNIYF